jgi:hypothetical protein
MTQAMTLDDFANLAPPSALIPRVFTEFCRWVGFVLTKGQFALARVAFDGVNPSTELEREIFGGSLRIPADARRTMVFRLGRYSGKSAVCGAAYGLFRMLTGDVSACGPGDEAAVGVVCDRMIQSKLVLKKALALAEGCPTIKRMIIRSTADSFSLRRPDGHVVTFIVTAKSAGGRAGRAFSWLLFVVDEAEFIDPANPAAAIKVDDVVSAAAPRILRGGSAILCSTPWPVESLVSKVFAANFGKPTHALVALAPSLVMRDNQADLAATREAEYAKSATDAAREFDCIITDAEGVFFESTLVDQAVAGARPMARKQKGSSGIDLAFVNDSAAHVAVERQGHSVVVVHVDMVSPKKGKPLVPSEVCASFVEDARDIGCSALISDGYYIETTREHATKAGMQVVRSPVAAKDISSAFVYLRDLLREGLLVLPPDPRLVGQLKSVLSVPMPGGRIKPELPRRRGQGHADLVSALVNAVWHDRRHGPMLRGTERVGNVVNMPQTFAGGWTPFGAL